MTQQVLIEQIVAEVMRRLMPTATPAPVSATSNQRQTNQLADLIITADVLSEKAAGQQQVAIAPKAIVTPSARDWLRHNRVELIRGAASKAAEDTIESDRLVITHSTDQTIDRVLEEADRPANGEWKRKSVSCADEAAKKVIGEFRRESSRVIVVLTSEPEVVACLANRSEKVKAAVITDAAAVAKVKSRLDGNVFVIDPAGRSFFELRNILRRVEG